MKTHLFFLCMLAPTVLHAGPRTSASYNVPVDTHNGGGTRSASTAYTNNGSVGEIAGVSSVAAPVAINKAGYIGQLYEVMDLHIAASPATLNESGTRQLAGSQLLDDLTTLAIPATNIVWSIQSGPLSIDANGLATAATVYQTTSAAVQGTCLGASSTLGLTVLDTIPDNYGTYGGDGIGDDWQVQYFGMNSANAAPLLDPDFDGLVNLLEWATHLNPTTSGRLPISTTRNGANFDFTYTRSVSALNAGAVFTVQWSDTLAPGSWSSAGVTQSVLSDDGAMQQIRAVIPVNAVARKFVRLSLSAPP